MEMNTFKYKLDFYYQQAIIYLIVLIIYIGLRGTFDFQKMPSLSSDPFLYVIVFFVMVSFAGLILNKHRDRKLIINSQELVFHQRDRKRSIPISEIEWMYIGRERFVKTAGRSQVVILKIKDRKRLIRIRIGRYEREDELLHAMEQLAEKVPKIKRPSISLRTDKVT